MNIRPYFPSLLSCFKGPLTKDTENTKKDEGQSASLAPAFPSTSKKTARHPSRLQKMLREKHSPEKNTPHWVSGSLLIEGEHRDSLLRQLKLEKANIASGGFGSVSIFENENGNKLVGKISKCNSWEDPPEGTLAVELKAYQSIYKEAGSHPNLVNVYGIAMVPDENGKLERALLMDAVPGPTGSKTFSSLRECWGAGKISTNEYWGAIQFLGRRLLDVVAHMSIAGVVHNDIKPRNFLVNRMTGEPVLIDLGSSCEKGAPVTRCTISYAPPEVISGTDVGEKSDVFCVGASLLHGIEGHTDLFPNNGIRRMDIPVKDDEENIKREPGTYSAETHYTFFMERVLDKDMESRFTPGDAKNLEFLNDSMLDDDAAKEVIKKAISLAGIEEKKPVEERWKRAESKYKVYNARDEKTKKGGEASAKGTSEAVLERLTKSGVNTNGVRLKREDKGFDFFPREPERAFELETHLEHRLKEHRLKSWHMKYPLVGLNAKFFEETILDSIQMGVSDNRSWAARTEDIGSALDKLEMLGPEQISSLSGDNKAALGKIFHTISSDVRVQQSRIEEILSEKKPASPELEWAKKALDAVGKQVERLSKYVDYR